MNNVRHGYQPELTFDCKEQFSETAVGHCCIARTLIVHQRKRFALHPVTQTGFDDVIYAEAGLGLSGIRIALYDLPQNRRIIAFSVSVDGSKCIRRQNCKCSESYCTGLPPLAHLTVLQAAPYTRHGSRPTMQNCTLLPIEAKP